MIEPPQVPGLDEDDDDFIEPLPRRRWVLGIVAALLAVLLVAGPLQSLFERSQPQFADNGLQICSIDYCEVQAAVRDAGHGPTMARLAGTVLVAEEAQALVDAVVSMIGGGEVTVEAVERLPGVVAGRYNAASRTIEVEEPIRAWVVIHEVAHTQAAGHDAAFLAVLLSLVQAIEEAG